MEFTDDDVFDENFEDGFFDNVVSVGIADGEGTSATGTVNVTGTGSRLTAWAFELGRGASDSTATGTLIVADGGLVQTEGIYFSEISGQTGHIHLNGTAGSRGVLEVDYVGTGNGTIHFDGGVLRAMSHDILGGQFVDDVTAALDVGAGGGTIELVNGDFHLNAHTVLTGSGALVFEGSNSYNVFLNASSASTFSGTFVFNGPDGYLRSDYDLPTAGFTINSGNIHAGGVHRTISSLAGTGGTLHLDGGGITVDQSIDTTYTGVVTDLGNAGYIEKSGTGTLTLAGANDYIGGTTVTAGTLKADSAGALPANTSFAVNGGTLDLNGYDLTTSNFTSTGGTVALGGATLTLDQGTNVTIAAGITGQGRLMKTGSGEVTLTGASTLSTATDEFAGAVTVKEGSLLVSGASASLVVTDASIFAGETAGDDAALYVNGGASLSAARGYIGKDSGATGAVTITDAGSEFTTSAGLAVGYEGTGTLTISNGAQATSAGETYIGYSSGSSGTATVTGAASRWNVSGLFTVGNESAGTLAIQNGGTVKVGDGTGTVKVGAHEGAVSTIEIGDANLSTTAGTLQAGVVDLFSSTSRVRFNQTDNATLSATITGAGSVFQRGTGETLLSGDNTYSGGTTITAGSIVALHDSALGTGTVAIDGGKLRAGPDTVIANAITVGPNGAYINNWGGFAQAAFTGSITLGGNLTIGANSATPASVTITGGITGTGNVTLENQDREAVLTISGAEVNPIGTIRHRGGGSGSTTIHAVVGANVTSLTQESTTSSLILNGNNLYTGPTTVEAGALYVNGSILSDTVVKSGATFGGSGVVNNITLESGANLRPIDSFDGNSMIWNAGATITLSLGPDGMSDILELTGELTKSGFGVFTFDFEDNGWEEGQTYTIIGFDHTDFSSEDFSFTNGDGFSGTFAIAGNALTFHLVAVPEPSSCALGMVGLLAALVTLQRRRARRA